ncbi:Osmoregulated proline transporter OpuE [Fusobacterium sp. DD29]|uniref:sodium:solute symporter family protein n=1 Tax=unclassified Fusobacterium TaxID=2648384 RepID=UPI001B8CC67A|nr:MULTISPECIES: sodium:solute symporter family protein [unclassified Fusobacterium]MBR8701754.1 Osmoregulated proline transporter OpuE [Fusobacterium sp. DD45]MBR8711535.1 Osmoregulated proline transporter OpuE [Fusobacterium sp. DD28]MBR8749924.1 Osmoregulated proline transporter OpuE [Fusobacterium sp. DD29]MBR8752084.1 Osmoregulated proline transporter OpuE [Fusobacterium sp. DD26]MBR8762166.1 Osmoregulated proline transporter OpuE [Fusobacterium sp. DD25]
MHFSWFLDGGIVGVYILISLLVGLSLRKYVGNVEDYLVAGREVNLYAGMASLAATEFGIVTCMAAAQLGYRYGFSGAMVGLLLCTSMFLVGKTGFCIKPLRDANAMTLPEFFEKKYSPRVRWAAGVIIVVGGLLNTGVFLRTGGEFLVSVVGLNPDYLEITMTILLIVVALYTVLGGMISVLVTDFLQFILMSAGMIIVTIYIVYNIGWGTIINAVTDTYGAAGFNPFINEKLGWQYVAYTFLTVSATVLTWQTMIARVLSCKDSTVAKKMYTKTSFFYIVRSLIPVTWGLAALTIWKPEALGGAPITAMPKFLAAVLPTGLIGIVVAAMLAADMSTDSSYLLGWASVIYNDIIAVLHKGTWSERKKVLVNKLLVAAIGLFLLFYGLWYPLKSDLWVYMTLTASIYSVSVSTLLIAACYWKKANTWGAYSAIVVGAATPLLFLIMQQIPATMELAKKIGPYYSGISAFVFAWIAMIVGSNLKIMLKK